MILYIELIRIHILDLSYICDLVHILDLGYINLIRYIRSNTYICFIFISYVSLFIYIGDNLTTLRFVMCSPHSFRIRFTHEPPLTRRESRFSASLRARLSLGLLAELSLRSKGKITSASTSTDI